jgi:hypothetical protein
MRVARLLQVGQRLVVRVLHNAELLLFPGRKRRLLLLFRGL